MSYKNLNPQTQLQELFNELDKIYFDSLFSKYKVELKWSTNMTTSAGKCAYKPAHKLLLIRLSKPILELRPNCDSVTTLLHEMIHGYTFVKNLKVDHGPNFKSYAKKIKEKGGYEITTRHNFIKEVEQSNIYFWKCNRCKLVIGRSTKRKPAFKHTLINKICPGIFIQISKDDYEKYKLNYIKRSPRSKIAKRKKYREPIVNKRICVE